MREPTDQPFIVPPRRHGIAHAIAATRYSIDGLRRLFGEAAFRQEVLAASVLFGTFAVVGVPLHAFVLQFVLFCMLLAVEALNTAVETIVDRVSPEYSAFAKQAKDLGSFAVFALLLANGAAAAYFLSGVL